MINNKSSQEILNLYELSLVISNSNNLAKNCQTFLAKLQEQKNISFCSIHLNNISNDNNKNEMVCFSSDSKALSKQDRQIDFLMSQLLNNKDYEFVTNQHQYFNKINFLEKETGKYIIFSLADLGVLLIYINDANKKVFSTYELKELTKIINKFANVINSNLDYIKLKNEIKETMKHKNYYHNLTNLPNRILFDDRLTLEINQLKKEKNKDRIAVLVIHIDKLSLVNNAFGYEKGDEVLKKIAQRLLSFIENYQQGTASHLGGNDFALFMILDKKQGLVETIKLIINKINQPFIINDQEISINCNIGVAVYPDDSNDAKDLLKKAEIAMQKNKDKYNNTFNFYNIQMEDKSIQRISLENNLKKALERKEFIVYYQPQIKVETGEIIGLEALLRWQKSSGEIIPPGEFIPWAEKSGLIIPIGNWILEKACRQVKKWQDMGFDQLELSINISTVQFQQDDFYDKIKSILTKVSFPSEHLTLEITEHLLMQNFENVNPILNNLKNLGVKISIDDFGTGFSSLSYLTNLPICELKIDKSFIFALEENKDNKIIAETIISLGKNLKTNIIAEGVEKIEHLEFLKDMDCHEAQGYLISHPLPKENIEKLLHSKNKFKKLSSFYNK